MIKRYIEICPNCGKEFRCELNTKRIYSKWLTKLYGRTIMIDAYNNDIICPYCGIDIDEYMFIYNGIINHYKI